MNDVVVGVDRSDTARGAAHAAATLAAADGVNLHLVTCAEPAPTVAVGTGSDRFESDWVDDADQFLKGLAADLPYDQVTWNVSSGDPANVIVDEATRIDAGTIVVGNVCTHGVGRVLGSVTGAVVKRALGDVLVAHTARSARARADDSYKVGSRDRSWTHEPSARARFDVDREAGPVRPVRQENQ